MKILSINVKPDFLIHLEQIIREAGADTQQLQHALVKVREIIHIEYDMSSDKSQGMKRE